MQPAIIRAIVNMVSLLPTGRGMAPTYTGALVNARTLWTARAFNAFVAPRLCEVDHVKFRQVMDVYGLGKRETNFTVGHIIPRGGGGSDLGSNLMAQHAQDNERLGCRVVSADELLHVCRVVDVRAIPAMHRSVASQGSRGIRCVRWADPSRLPFSLWFRDSHLWILLSECDCCCVVHAIMSASVFFA